MKKPLVILFLVLIVLFLVSPLMFAAQQVEWRPPGRPHYSGSRDNPPVVTEPSRPAPTPTIDPPSDYIPGVVTQPEPPKDNWRTRAAAQKVKNLAILEKRRAAYATALRNQYNQSRLRATGSGTYRICPGGKCSR